MSGLELFSLADGGAKVVKPLLKSIPSGCSEYEITGSSSARQGLREGLGECFASELEAALAAVRLEPQPTSGGNALPIPPLAAQSLGESTRLITAANAESTTEEALFALALSQGLDPEVVAGVLWPGQPGLAADAAGVMGSAGRAAGDGRTATLTDPFLLRGTGASALQGVPAELKAVPVELAPASLRGRESSPSHWISSIQSAVAAGVERATADPGSFLEGSAPPALAGLAGPDRASRIAGAVPGAAAAQIAASVLSPAAGQLGLMTESLAAQALPPGRRERNSQAVGAIPDGISEADLLIKAAAQPGDRSALQALAPPAAQWMSRQFRSDSIGLSSGLSPWPPATAAAEPLDGSATSLRTDATPDTSALADPDPVGAMPATRTESIDLLELQEGLERTGRTEADRELARQRMSEALAGRMIAHVNRGHWSLHLELKPSDLGAIAIEMSLHNGRLEAMFDAPSPAARALIAEGLERLRQDLEKSGMNVAHLGMQQFAGGSGGGKPTAGRFERRAESGAGEALPDTDTEMPADMKRTASDRILDIRV
jgi:hypothetical protein